MINVWRTKTTKTTWNQKSSIFFKSGIYAYLEILRSFSCCTRYLSVNIEEAVPWCKCHCLLGIKARFCGQTVSSSGIVLDWARVRYSGKQEERFHSEEVTGHSGHGEPAAVPWLASPLSHAGKQSCTQEMSCLWRGLIRNSWGWCMHALCRSGTLLRVHCAAGEHLRSLGTSGSWHLTADWAYAWYCMFKCLNQEGTTATMGVWVTRFGLATKTTQVIGSLFSKESSLFIFTFLSGWNFPPILVFRRIFMMGLHQSWIIFSLSCFSSKKLQNQRICLQTERSYCVHNRCFFHQTRVV